MIPLPTVTLINTYHTTGGAAVACRRLALALRRHGTAATLLVQQAARPEPFVEAVATGFAARQAAFARFAAERLFFYFHEQSRQARFAFSPANTGLDISRHPAVVRADVLHLHWVHFGFLSLASLEKLLALGKPVVWTLHDMWAFTGGCHYTGGCQHYRTHCGQCPYLHRPAPRDLSWRVFEAKRRLFAEARVQFVTCSQWLAGRLGESALLGGFPVTAIPNPIDTNLYRPLTQAAVRQKLGLPPHANLLLFGAMNTQDARKGFAYLEQALHLLAGQKPLDAPQTELVIFGKADAAVLARLPFRVHDFGSVSGDAALVDLYNACDALVLPSLQDNLPNTVMESLACGTPAVAFDTGGVPELIDHQQNGYLAAYQSAEDLARGIAYVLDAEHKVRLQTHARLSVERRFSEEIVAGRYQQVYEAAASRLFTPPEQEKNARLRQSGDMDI